MLSKIWTACVATAVVVAADENVWMPVYGSQQHALQAPSVSPISVFSSAEQRTIYELVKSEPHFSNISRAIDFAGKDVISLLNDTAAGITFFAIPNEAIHIPHHGHHDELLDESRFDLSTAVSLAATHDAESVFGGDDKDKERRKEFFRKIVAAILSYHVLPGGFNAEQLSQNNTFATSLTLPDGSYDGQPLRIKVDTKRITHAISINFLSKVVKSDIAAKNGVVHVLDHPLLPPPSIMQGLFGLPSFYSILTSALQRTAVSDALERRYIPGKDGKKGSVQGTPATTFFAPTNLAFEALPVRLRAFLFSPFGEHVLGKLLSYHVVPTSIIHSDYIHNVSSSVYEAREATAKPNCHGKPKSIVASVVAMFKKDAEFAPFHRGAKYFYEYLAINSVGEEPIFSTNLNLPTLLANHTLHVDIAKYKVEPPIPIPGRAPSYVTEFKVNGKPISVVDVVARNGAAHSIDFLLDPRPSKDKLVSESNEWEDWEEWLEEWAVQA